MSIGAVKHDFLSKSSPKSDPISFKDYDFHLDQLNIEFLSLYKLFISNKDYLKKDSEIVSYLHYLCELMIQYYQDDYDPEYLKDIEKKKKEIEAFMLENSSRENQTIKFPTFLLDGIKNNAMDYASSFASTSKLREHISSLHTNWIYWNYSRAVANHAIIYLQNSGFSDLIKEINKKIGHHYNPESFNELLDTSRETLRALSVGLRALRLTINLVALVEHIIYASISEELSSQKVLEQEIEKRGFTMVNDLVWGTVNLLTNYKEFFHISSEAASQINFVFLAFDVALLLARWSFEADKYNARAQELMLQKNKLKPSLELSVVNRQLDILNDDWEAQCVYYKFNLVATHILMAALGATFLVSGPLALASVAALNMLANALSNTAEEYKKYKQASIAVQREVANAQVSPDMHHQNLLQELNAECQQANINFWKTLAFNVGATAFIITAAATSWPVACGLTLSYMAYKLNDAYQKHLQEENKKQEPHDIYRLFSSDTSKAASSELISDVLPQTSPPHTTSK